MIDSFKGPNRWLSNFDEHPVFYNGLLFICREGAYQAEKTLDMSLREGFRNLSGKEARAAGQLLALRPGWAEMRARVMSEVVHACYCQNRDLRQMLLETHNQEMIEGNYWHDEFFGVCSCRGKKPGCGAGLGKNWLGRTHMAERAYWVTLASTKR